MGALDAATASSDNIGNLIRHPSGGDASGGVEVAIISSSAPQDPADSPEASSSSPSPAQSPSASSTSLASLASSASGDNISAEDVANGPAVVVSAAPQPPLGGGPNGGAKAKAASDEGPSSWSGFHKKALKERQNQLRLVFPSLFSSAAPASTTSTTTSAGTPPLVTPPQHGDHLSPSTSPTRRFGASSDPDLHSTAQAATAPGIKRGHGSTASLANLDVGAPANEVFPITGLDELVANNMIENCVGTMGLPVGLALNFVINSVPVVIPMAVEEPSVVAAVSGAAKTFSGSGGFTASTSERNIIFSQVVLNDVDDVLTAAEKIRASKAQIIDVANSYVPGMVSRGGGVVDMTVRTPSRSLGQPRKLRPNEVPTSASARNWLVVHFHLDVCDAMGANAASTVSEGVAPTLASLVNGRIGLRIVSNLCVERLAKASFRIPLPSLAYKSVNGRTVAERIIEATEWARDDPYRATTHNKGIMNGIDAVAMATGQDWRAIEAAAHAWAAKCGVSDAPSSATAEFSGTPSYGPLTSYWIEADADVGPDGLDKDGRGLYFCGELEMPISVGTKGGVLKTNPVYNYTLGMMGFPDSKQLAMAMVAVGLAQNFAALRALTTEGIQRGHMSLHARNIAIAAGAPPHAINECCAYMVESGRVNIAVAKEYLQAHELHTSFSNIVSSSLPPKQPPSTFYFEEAPGSGDSPLEGRISLNIAFQTLGPRPVHIMLTRDSPSTPLLTALFGEKSHAWITATFELLETIELSTAPSRPGRSNHDLAKKLKMLSTLLNIVVRRMMAAHPAETRRFIEHIRGSVGRDGVASKLGGHRAVSERKSSPLSVETTAASSSAEALGLEGGPTLLQVGRPLILALWQVFDFRVLQWVGHAPLAAELLDAQQDVIRALVEIPVPGGSRIKSRSRGLSSRSADVSVEGSDRGKSDSEDTSDDPDGGIVIMKPTTPSKSKVSKTSESSNAASSANLEDRLFINSKAPTQPPASVISIMSSHARRFQVSLFLLCDASTFDPAILTPARVSLLTLLGSHFCWEQTCAHDLSPPRLLRDLASAVAGGPDGPGISSTGALGGGDGVVNGFLVWLGWRLCCSAGVQSQRGGVELVAARLAAVVRDDKTFGEADEQQRMLLSVLEGEPSGVTLSVGAVEQLLASSSLSLHNVFAEEIAEFVKLLGSREAHVDALLEADTMGEVFGKDTFRKVTHLYREYYGVTKLFV